MYRLKYLISIFTLMSIFGAQTCLADTPRLTGPVQRTPRLDSAHLQKLRTLPSREVIIKTLMEDPATEEVLKEEAEKLGISASRLETLAVNPLPTKTVLSTEQLREIEGTIADERAFMELDWENGVTFTIDDIPTYGPSNYKLGFLQLFSCRLISERTTHEILVEPEPSGRMIAAVSLGVELPREEALYAVTFKVSTVEGPCPPNWHKSSIGTRTAPVWVSSGLDAFPLTPLPDGIGYVAVLNAGTSDKHLAHYKVSDLPEELVGDGMFGMRKCTKRIHLMLNPIETHSRIYHHATHPDEPMTSLIFDSVTITRL